MKEEIIKKMKAFMPYLNEAQRRLYAASETRALGRGGKRLIEKELGISHNTINQGIIELESSGSSAVCIEKSRQRKEGGGRKKVITQNVWEQIEAFIMPHAHGEPAPFQWVSKNVCQIEHALKTINISASHKLIGDALKSHGFSVPSNRKCFEENSHPNRDAQFQFIQKKVDKYLSAKQPVISVNARKRKLTGEFKDDEVAVPYGVYDMKENTGWINVGITKDTAEFAVQAVSNWWYGMGIYYHNRTENLLITADSDDGSNSDEDKLWKDGLQKFANETGLTVEVIHFPPCTSKWNRIEHRLFSYILKNWRRKPLAAYQIIVSLIAAAKTKRRLKAAFEIDGEEHETDMEISDEQLAATNICPDKFHDEWNYRIFPE